jgi:succinyl-diaminopimelate desuccinylase
MSGLDLTQSAARLTAAIVDIESESGEEKALADVIEEALRAYPHLEVLRDGDSVLARTNLGRAERVILAGHLDTVPIAVDSTGRRNVPSLLEGDWETGTLHGCGTSDMKAGVAVQLVLAAELAEPNRDVTYVFYECEEVEAERNSLGRLIRTRPEWFAADFAVLLEPSNNIVEGGCQGTMRARLTFRGARAHSARSWLGDNAIHKAGAALRRLAEYQPRRVEVEGLEFREGLNAVGISGGVAGNVIPDECSLVVNFRFAPDRSQGVAERHVREVFADLDAEIVVTDSAPAARPGLHLPLAAEFIGAVMSGVQGEPTAKFGWTDVARFAELGVPGVNYGPGDGSLAHKPDESVDLGQVVRCAERMRSWLGSASC